MVHYAKSDLCNESFCCGHGDAPRLPTAAVLVTSVPGIVNGSGLGRQSPGSAVCPCGDAPNVPGAPGSSHHSSPDLSACVRLHLGHPVSPSWRRAGWAFGPQYRLKEGFDSQRVWKPYPNWIMQLKCTSQLHTACGFPKKEPCESPRTP